MTNTLKEIVFPVGQTYITQTDTNPVEILGFGTWERLKGKVVVGLDENTEEFNEIGKEIGEVSTKLFINNIPPHSHILHAINPNEDGYLAANGNDANYALKYNADNAVAKSTKGWTNTIAMGSAGGGETHNNVQPTKVVGYMWIRTA